MKNIVLDYIIITCFFLIILGVTLVFSSGFVNAGEGMNATMTVKVDLVGFNTTGGGEISIWVPDEIDLGQVTKTDHLSDEKSFYINNTGTIDIRVTPILIDEEEIFKWLFFRNYKNSSEHPDEMIPKKIGDYFVDIDKPLAGSTKRSKRVYMQLNLTDFDGEIKEDVNNYNAEIVFLATAR